MKKQIAGIRRDEIYSPNHTGNDSAIFSLVAQELEKMHYQVRRYTESEFAQDSIPDLEMIFTMARNKYTLGLLKKAEQQGIPVVNSPGGIEKCFRSNMTRYLVEQSLPYPKSVIVPTLNYDIEEIFKINCQHLWIKRGDFHTMNIGDISLARNIEEVQSVLHEFARRDIDHAVISEHIKGDLVKFYGVRETEFFYWFYPFDHNHSKFGHELINGKTQQFDFDQEYLKEIADNAAKTLDVYIYGGDAIVDEIGNLTIIDLNDWPSFAPCRNDAAPYIAQIIHQLTEKK